MLHAITENKTGRIEVNGKKVSIRQLFREREDMLTATIFSRLSYLSTPALHQFFSALIPSTDLSFGNLREVEFWPRFSLEGHKQNLVEPDVLLNFDWGTLVVEVKRPKDGIQSYQQWHRELDCLPNEYTEGEVLLLALGGDSKHNQQMITQLNEKLVSIDFPFQPSLFEMNWKLFGNIINNIILKDNIKLLSTDIAVFKDFLLALELYRVNYRQVDMSDLSKINKSRIKLVKNILALPKIKK